MVRANIQWLDVRGNLVNRPKLSTKLTLLDSNATLHFCWTQAEHAEIEFNPNDSNKKTSELLTNHES